MNLDINQLRIICSTCVFVPHVEILQVGLIMLLILSGHLYLNGVWLGVDLKTDTKKTCR